MFYENASFKKVISPKHVCLRRNHEYFLWKKHIEVILNTKIITWVKCIKRSFKGKSGSL